MNDDFAPCTKELLMEVSRREKEAGIVPDPDLDAYMKVLHCTSSLCPPSSFVQFSICFNKKFPITNKG